MSTTPTTLIAEETSAGIAARLADYVELTKPRISLLVLITVSVGFCVAAKGLPSLGLMFHTLLGTALVAASASAFNQWIERHRDALMDRTAARPLPGGRLTEREVLVFGAATVVLGTFWLAVNVNLLTATLGVATWASYVLIYTQLKPRTSLNTMVGAVAGALPILMGWTSTGLPLNVAALALFMIVYLWQFPHFMAIAWLYRRQYDAAGMRMMTVVDPSGRSAGLQAVIAALALVPVSLLPAAMRLTGPAYLAGALILGLLYIFWSVRFFRRLDEASARGLLRYSVLYLPSLMGMLMSAPLLDG